MIKPGAIPVVMTCDVRAPPIGMHDHDDSDTTAQTKSQTAADTSADVDAAAKGKTERKLVLSPPWP